MDGVRPYAVVIFIQLLSAGSFMITKAAFTFGLNPLVFVFYRQAAGTVLLVPLAMILVIRRKTQPPLPFMLLFKTFMLVLIGMSIHFDMCGIALSYVSATAASSIINSLPVFTFIFAVLFRMETLKLKSRSGIVKILGIIFCGILLKDYQSKLLFTTFLNMFSTIQSFIIAIIFQRDFAKWKLHWDIGLLAIGYCGVLVTGLSYYLQAWCVEKKGPVFLVMSTPLSSVFTMIGSSFILGEKINLGSVLGGISMVAGLYSVLWGKSMENKVAEPSSTERSEC
ncbi:LOW QUALITY PROTEIN: WAT1-related protein At5g64700-like [Dioscorea cayenensis subsp. rotundata]|uniref:WAT1-related protein n=1 Tax=Dioscorea cayennensis subsp. rotundata TaxID=55577 RepID=A0AB40C1V8_DIOCR|nr:LOW QUALITY PROTEIN: WAT1-related protein At5g64700-like [Dioscorea cayenensis subsp. rotundata]